jgi:hypothetical protein
MSKNEAKKTHPTPLQKPDQDILSSRKTHDK